MTGFCRATAVALCICLGWPAPVAAESCGIPEPTGEPLVTIQFEGTNATDGQAVGIDLPGLEVLQWAEFSTSTIWTDGPQTFSGVLLLELMGCFGVADHRLRLWAKNDYTVEIDGSSYAGMSALIAVRRNGELMSVRDKGPLWLVFPYDTDEKFRTETIFAQSIWQLERIEVLP